MLGGLMLAKSHVPGLTGAWNAGVLSYFAGGRIVNLDGLMNDEVFDYVRRNALLMYLAERDVRHIADFGVMIDDRMARQLGGYDTPTTDACIIKTQELSKTLGLSWMDSEHSFYKVDTACIRAAPDTIANKVTVVSREQ
jgi:hypothetical protein